MVSSAAIILEVAATFCAEASAVLTPSARVKSDVNDALDVSDA
jgi:hypothetical protein